MFGKTPQKSGGTGTAWSAEAVGPAKKGVSTVELQSPRGKKTKVNVRHFPLDTGYVKTACD